MHRLYDIRSLPLSTNKRLASSDYFSLSAVGSHPPGPVPRPTYLPCRTYRPPLLPLPDCVCWSLRLSSLAGLGMNPTSQPSLTSRPIHQSLLNFCKTREAGVWLDCERVYGQFCIETLHERRKRRRKFNGLFVKWRCGPSWLFK